MNRRQRQDSRTAGQPKTVGGGHTSPIIVALGSVAIACAYAYQLARVATVTL